jgi:uncharacterized membrane protein
MAQRKKQKRPAKPPEPKRVRREGSLAMGSRNALMLFVGIVVIVIGYFLLGRGSITAAPLLLVLGYCVVVPLSIILWVKRSEKDNQGEAGE